MSSTIETLRRMVNDIARNLQFMGDEQAVKAVADHINMFWDPRMKAQIFADDNRDALSPIGRAAIEELAAGHTPASQTQATEFSSAHEVGHSDAG